MAKKSMIEKNNRRRRMTKKFSNRRKALKAISHDKKLPMEERFAAILKLAEMPRNSSATRIRNRCEITGRPRAYYRKHRLSRIALRDLGSKAGLQAARTRLRGAQDRRLYSRLCRRGACRRPQRARDRAEIFRRRAGDPRDFSRLQARPARLRLGQGTPAYQ